MGGGGRRGCDVRARRRRSTGRAGAPGGLVAALVASLVVGVPSAAGAKPLFDIPAADPGVPTIHDGDPATTERLLRGEPVAAAIEVSTRRFGRTGLGDRQASGAVLARADDFADALAGSGLLADAPLLLTPRDRLDPRVETELVRALAPGAEVVLLGGRAALSDGVEAAVRDLGFVPVRLAGSSRVETAVAVATEVHRRSGRSEVLLARAYGVEGDATAAWADSVAAGGLAATLGLPLLVTPSDEVHGAVRRFLDGVAPTRTILLGGIAALSESVANAVPNPTRLSGHDRVATAAALAEVGWGAARVGERSFIVVNGYRDDGWAFGLVAAGLSSDARSPILLVGETVAEPVRRLVRTCGSPEVDLALVGDGAQVTASVRERLDTLDRDACGAGGTLRADAALTTFTGCPAALAYHQELALERVGPYGLAGGFVGLPAEEDAEEGAPAAPAPTVREVTGTNVQETGVDEPDIVETDGDRALAVARGTVQVLDLRGASPRLASTLDVGGGTHELLLHGTRALVLTRTYPWEMGAGPSTAAASSPVPVGQPRTVLRLFDVDDPDLPVRLATTEIEGELRSARSVDGVVRVVVQSYPSDLDWSYPTGGSADDEERAAEANREVIRRSSIAEWAATYATVDGAGTPVADGLLVACDRTSAPPRASELGAVSVATFDLAGDLTPTSGASIAASSETVYASLDRLVVATTRWQGWRPDLGDAGVTELHAFDISDPTRTVYTGSGAVPGFVLSPFSLSTHEGSLRVATTEGVPWGPEPTSQSAITILSETGSGELRQVGRVDGIGAGERIFAVRFLGDVAAVVTFRQIDPLHLIDLSDPTRPRVTGEVELPGFSTYLHRVGPDLLLGVGQETDGSGATVGAKLVTFDIADRSAPRVVAQVVYPGAYSEVESDHHAFLFSATDRLAVVPLDRWDDQNGFHGAVALTVAPDGGLVERGRVAHPQDGAWPVSVRRSFLVGQVLYTTSESGLATAGRERLDARSWTPFR